MKGWLSTCAHIPCMSWQHGWPQVDPEEAPAVVEHHLAGDLHPGGRLPPAQPSSALFLDRQAAEPGAPC